MKNYKLSNHAKKVITERNIKKKWIEEVFEFPAKIESDAKNDILEHRLKSINEYGNRILRIVINKKEKPQLIVTAFFDRRMKGKLK
ncbi:MAG: DUF4258 domain-containing protein [Melioribacteraceae bacterium]|nr:DUF4258 domain-containing protein [Saprospiraceae bacterium]MCF8355771.1 DUF4258 domain-containing protein [Melioribacteraceae bacterium]MCF8394799.1 DUF4258 domain-containing protein [Melioribacteraceae bacterium]